MHIREDVFIYIGRRRFVGLTLYSSAKVQHVTSYQRVISIADFGEYEGKYHKENKAAVYSEIEVL